MHQTCMATCQACSEQLGASVPLQGSADQGVTTLCACRASKRLLLLDYDGTLSPGGGSSGQRGPSPQILAVLHGLCADAANTVFIISGRGRAELRGWFSDVVRLLLKVPGPVRACRALQPRCAAQCAAHVRTRLAPSAAGGQQGAQSCGFSDVVCAPAWAPLHEEAQLAGGTQAAAQPFTAGMQGVCRTTWLRLAGSSCPGCSHLPEIVRQAECSRSQLHELAAQAGWNEEP